MSDLGQSIKQRLSTIQSGRKNWESMVQMTYDFIDPTNGQVTRNEASGQQRFKNIYDNVALDAYDKFQNGFYSHLTPDNQEWLAADSPFEDLKDSLEVSTFFNEISRITLNEIASSNFSMEIQQVYADLGIPGRALIIALDNPNGGVRYKTFHYASSYIAEDQFGEVDTFYRTFEWTARQAFQRWGDKLSDRIRDAAKSDHRFNDKFKFIHAVFPRAERDLRKGDNLNMPFADVYLEFDNAILLEEGGFHEKPFAAPRFYKDNNEVEGRSPGQKALQSVMMINAEALSLIKSANWDSDPPMMLPDDDLLQYQIAPGARFPYRPNALGAKPEFLVKPSKNELAEWVYNGTKQAIQDSFFVDLFAMLSSSLDQKVERTAFEIRERLNEKVDLRSIAKGRMFIELLTPLMNRTINLLFRQGKFPELPQELLQRPDFKIEYKSRLAILAKSLQLRAVNDFMLYSQPIFEMFPETVDKIVPDELINIGANVLALPSVVIREQDEVDQIRQSRQQQQQLQEEAAMATEAAKAVPALQGKTEQGSPLEALAS